MLGRSICSSPVHVVVCLLHGTLAVKAGPKVAFVEGVRTPFMTSGTEYVFFFSVFVCVCVCVCVCV